MQIRQNSVNVYGQDSIAIGSKQNHNILEEVCFLVHCKLAVCTHMHTYMY